MVNAILWLALGFLWGTFLEWFLHKYLLHKYAQLKRWTFHLAHHRFCVKEGGRDHEYDEPFFRSIPRMKEVGGLLLLTVVHLPFVLVSFWLWLGMAIFAQLFWIVHFSSHIWPEWGWRWVPWHMEHHMVNAGKNFGIVTPLWDWLLGTLIVKRK